MTASALKLPINDHSFLLALREEDAEPLFEITQANREYLRAWLPWVDATQSVVDTMEFIQTMQASMRERHSYTFGLWAKDRLIGVIGVHLIDSLNRATSLGYWMEAPSQGQGHMTRGVQVLLAFIFQELQLHRVEIRCATGNVKSQAIPRRLGFQEEGVLRESGLVNGRYLDLILFGLLAREWKAAGSS